MNIFNKKHLSTTRSRLIFSVMIGVFGFAFLLWLFFIVDMYSNGRLTLYRAVFMTAVCAAIGAVWGLLMWATAIEPLRRAREREIKKQASNVADIDKIPASNVGRD